MSSFNITKYFYFVLLEMNTHRKKSCLIILQLNTPFLRDDTTKSYKKWENFDNKVKCMTCYFEPRLELYQFWTLIKGLDNQL